MQNFWEKPRWEQEDKQLSDLAKQAFIRPFPALKIHPKSLYTIRGPRQVGKSTWLKSLLRDFALASKAYYLSCDQIPDYKTLNSILESLRGEREFILIDEISFVREWWRCIKSLIDSGFPATFVLTGSHAHDIRKGADLLPGRYGKGQDLELLPMDFFEFQAARKRAGWGKKSHTEELVDFFRIGGFPSALLESGPKAIEPLKAQETYWKWLRGDALKLGKSEQYLKEVMGQVATIMPSSVSLQGIARNTSIGSHHTAQDYIAFLEDSFALRTCFAVDKDKGSFHFRKNKKFYFSDPLLFWVALREYGVETRSNFAEALAEMTAHEHLFRKFRQAKKRFGCYQSPTGEIDFLCPKSWAIEVKWSLEPKNFSKAWHSLVIPQKILWKSDTLLKSFPE